MANKKKERISEYDFVVRTIKRFRQPPYLCIHSVFSGFEKVFWDCFNKDPLEAASRLDKEGKIVTRPAKGGLLLYLPQDVFRCPSSKKGLKRIPEPPGNERMHEMFLGMLYKEDVFRRLIECGIEEDEIGKLVELLDDYLLYELLERFGDDSFSELYSRGVLFDFAKLYKVVSKLSDRDIAVAWFLRSSGKERGSIGREELNEVLSPEYADELIPVFKEMSIMVMDPP